MPIYEFRCSHCGSDFEKLMRMSDAFPPCPKCGAGDVTKLVSAAAFVLKGGGWYKDHYGLKSGAPDAGKAEGAAKSEGTPAKTDTGSKGGEGSSSSGSSGSSSSGSVPPSGGGSATAAA